MTVPRVLANLCSIVPRRVGGSEPHAVRLLAAVAALDSPPDSAARLELAAMAGTRSAHPELASLRWNEAAWRGGSRVLRMAVESTWLDRLSDGFDVVHHFGGRLPARRPSSAASVVAVHDVQPLDLPGNFSPAKRAYLGWALPRSVRAATLVTVPSEWTADRVIDRLGVPPERIRVVPSTYTAAGPVSGVPGGALSSERGPPGRGQAVEPVSGALADALTAGMAARPGGQAAGPVSGALAEVLRTGGRPFVLYPAATYPHKNHETLIDAHAAVWARHREPLLVLTGGRGRAHGAVARRVADARGVVHLGWVGEGLLSRLVAEAVALAFPSRYEGFGLPVLEAMAAGTPVIAASAAALPEVVADAGTLVHPDDIDGWVVALMEARSASARVEACVQRGLARAADFSPDRAARRLTDAWRRAAELRS